MAPQQNLKFFEKSIQIIDRYKVEWRAVNHENRHFIVVSDDTLLNLIRKDIFLNEIIIIGTIRKGELSMLITRYTSNLTQAYNKDYGIYLNLINEYLK